MPCVATMVGLKKASANETGSAISLPLFKHSNGMPFGLQVMSASFNETGLLQFSEALLETKIA